jgi:hypothetical protein
MKTLRGNAPFWRYGDSTRRMRGDLLLSCALLLIPQAVRFGLRPLLLTLARWNFAFYKAVFNLFQKIKGE